MVEAEAQDSNNSLDDYACLPDEAISENTESEPQTKIDTTCITELQDTRGNANISCPQCGSKRPYNDGFRYLSDGTSVQRMRCRVCCYRFSKNRTKLPLQKTSKQSINTASAIETNRQICAILEEAKNLTTATETKTVAGETEKAQQELKGKIIQYAITLKNKGKSEQTIRTYLGALCTLQRKGANLLDPENVEEIIAKQETWSIRAKRNYIDWYSRFAKFLHLTWEKPDYKAPVKVPFLPTEAEIDQLISGSPRKVSIALQIAKETAARIGEIVRIKWTDINFQNNLIAINEPEKGSNSGVYKVSNELLTRILKLPKTSDRIFGKGSRDSLTNGLITTKKKLASSFCNPRLLQIHFHTLRHWKLTTYAHLIKDPFQVQLFARHKDMKSTTRYIHLERAIYNASDNDEWIVKAAKTVDEASKLISVGFEYVTEVEGFKLFRKRK